jgi:heparin binding hemagglutinin HbhA
VTVSTKTITQSKPFYVVAGAGDLAVKKLREMPAKLSTLRVDRKDIEGTIVTLQQETKALPAKAQTAAVGLVSDVADRADAVYGDLVSRGRSVVTRVRRQKASQDLSRSAATTVRRTKATGTSAKKATADTRSAARGTATTAKKRAASTKKTAKSATTAASNTASTAARAASDAGDKLGR